MNECKDCRFWSRRQGTQDGYCCRHAPRPVEQAARDAGEPLFAWWPRTMEYNGCGEFAGRVPELE